MELALDLVTRGEVTSLEALVEEHKRMVYRIAWSVLRNHHDAEDAAQETFLRVWRAGATLPGITDRKAWIARIAWNVAADRLRSRQARSETALDPLAEKIAGRIGHGASAEQVAAGAEMQRLLEALIGGLPRKLREVLLLSTVEELEPAEVGRILGLDPAAVRMRLFQARQLLREKLERVLGKAQS